MNPPETDKPTGGPICIGHRGAKGHLPENTLPSFARAIELGCEWIELDVYEVEGELVVIHDDNLERTTNGRGAVMEQTLGYLRSLDAGDGAQIPTLQEVIALVDHRCGINVELKGAGTAVPVSELLSSYCDNGWSAEDFLLSSFDHRELALADPRYRRGALFGRLTRQPWDRAARLDAWSVNFDRRTVTEALVSEAHSRGYRVLVYTVNEPDELETMIRLGVDGVFTDFPDRLIALRDAA